MKYIFIVITISILGTFIGEAFADATTPQNANEENRIPQFPTEVEAKKHCPTDTVVWKNLKEEGYYFEGEQWYGSTISGSYICKNEADKNGYVAAVNKKQ